MRYILMMHAPRATGDYQINSWSPEDFQAHIAFMRQFNKDLVESGEFVGVQGLAAPGEAKLVRAGKDGVPITDGPFAESKELIGGFAVMELGSLDEAVDMCRRYADILGGTLEIDIRVVDTPAQ